jgi:hypothetical protein
VLLPVHLPHAASLQVEVFDILGRKVRTLLEDLPAGDRRLRWDGNGRNGDPVTRGVYWLRIRAGDRTWTRKVIVGR